MAPTKTKKGGLKARLTRLALTPALTVAAVMTILAFICTISAYTYNYEDEALALAGAYSTSIENLVDDLSRQFDVVTENPDIVDESLSAEERKAIINKSASTSTFKDFSLAYSDGKTLNDTDISQRDYFINAMANKDAYVSSPLLRMTDNSLTIMMGKYFSANGQDYLMYGGLDTDIVNNVIKEVHFGDNGLCFIIDKNGMIIAASDTEKLPILTELQNNAELDSGLADLADISADMLTYEEGTKHVEIAGQDYYLGYAPVAGEEGWSIAIATPWAPVRNTLLMTAGMILLIAIAISLLTLPIIFLFIKRIATPITKTADRLVSFSEGDLTSDAPTTDMGGEIGAMTDALSTMKDTMQSVFGDMGNVLDHISEGDLTVGTAVDYKGDFAQVKANLDHIREELNRTMTEVGRSADEVKDGASQLADGSTQLSENAVTQASAVNEIASTIENIAAKTIANNENVARALETVQQTNEKAQEGSASMNDMLEAISEIEASSNEISQIMKVIDDIAFQTNILALNAAIEAARAGEAGKGFAVVADEVRNLAGKSQEAAKQTGELINRSIAAVNRGTELADATSGALDSIVAGVEEISNVMTGIADANNEQTTAIEQISTGMENVNNAIHNTTATAEQSAAASEELSALAVTLSDEVGHFKTM
ncbi:MAG: HAMP domain-containing protein [Ruminococcaceae bacterium]|nr:HAMP domain-containing protein [Oscillospiraceae bacterium]